MRVVRAEDGATKRVTGDGPTPAIAEANLQNNIALFHAGRDRRSARTLAVLVDEWEQGNTTNSPASRKRVVSNIKNHVLPRLKTGITLSEVTHARMTRLVRELDAECTPSVAKNAFNALSTVLTYAWKSGLISENPLRRIDKPRYAPKSLPRDRALIDQRVEDYRALLAGLRACDDPAYFWVLILGLGLRRAEVCGLKWGDIEGLWDDGPDARPQIVVRHTYHREPTHSIVRATKNGIERRIPLSPLYVNALREWHAQWRPAEEEWATDQVFAKQTKKDGVKGFKTKRLYLDFTQALRSSIDPDGAMADDAYMRDRHFSPHACRKISASLMRGAGLPVETCRAVLGHLTPAMTEHYTSPLYDTQMQATQALGSAVTSPDAPPTAYESWMDTLSGKGDGDTAGSTDPKLAHLLWATRAKPVDVDSPDAPENAPESP